MSDVPQGPDWWQASDDLWYPPPRPDDPAGPAADSTVPETGPAPGWPPGYAGPGPAADPGTLASPDPTLHQSPPGGTTTVIHRGSDRTTLLLVLGVLVAASVLGLVAVLRGGGDGGEDQASDRTSTSAGAGNDGTPPTSDPGSSTTVTVTPGGGPPPNDPPTTLPPTSTPRTTAPPAGGVQAVVDAAAARWDGATCTWQGHEYTRPYYAAPPTQACTGDQGYVPDGSPVELVCWASGREIRDDQGNTSATWLYVRYADIEGYMNTLYFTTWASDPSAGLPAC